MCRHVELGRRAEKDLKALAPKVREVVVQALLTGLTEDPPPENLDVKPLKGAAPWMRLRVGDYRIVYRALNPREMQGLLANNPGLRAETAEARKSGEPTGWLVARIVNRRDLTKAVAGLR